MSKTTTFKLIKSNDFIRARPTGELDLDESKRILLDLARMQTCPCDYDILIDLRQARANLTYAEIYQLVGELGSHRSVFRNKIAVLTRPDLQFDKAEFMQLCAQNRGFQVEAFTEFEEAIDWLSEFVDLAADRLHDTS